MAERMEADAALESLKGQEQCMVVMIHILSHETPEHNEYIRQLALSILNDWMKTWWNNISEENQMHIRTNITGLLGNSTMVAQSKGLRTKLAVTVCNIAERQYPQKWPTFLEDIVGMWLQTQEAGQREICIMTLEFLVEDCIDGDFNNTLPVLRRNDILTG